MHAFPPSPPWRWAVLALVLGVCAGAHADEPYRDPQGRFVITVPAEWVSGTPRADAAASWTRGEDEQTVTLWVTVRECAPGREGYTPLEATLLEVVQPWLDLAYRMASASPLEAEALEGQGVEQGIGLRLSEADSRSQVFLVVMGKGVTAYIVGITVPYAAAKNPTLMGSLPEIVSSFRVTAPGGPPEPSVAEPAGDPPGTDPPKEPVAAEPTGEPPDPGTGGEPAVEPPSDYVSDLAAVGAGLGEGWAWELPSKQRATPPVATGDGHLRLGCGLGRPLDPAAPAPLLVRRQVPASLDATVTIRDLPGGGTPPCEASLVLLGDSGRSAVLSRHGRGDAASVSLTLYRRGGREERAVRAPGDHATLRLWYDGRSLRAFVSTTDGVWLALGADPVPLSLAAPRLGLYMGGVRGLPLIGITRVAVTGATALGPTPRPEGVAGPLEDGTLECGIRNASGTGAIRRLSVRVTPSEGNGPVQEVTLARDTADAAWSQEPSDLGLEGGLLGEVTASDGAPDRLVLRLAPAEGKSLGGVRVAVRAVDADGLDSGWWELSAGGAEPE